jgi:ADP-ribose pyrophosphatase
MILAMREPVEVRTTHRGRLLTVEVLSWTDENGRAVVREVVHHPGAVVIVPWRDDGRLVLIRNERVAAGQRLLELPAGTLEAGEDPRDAAARELAEETGYRPARVEPLGEFFTTPGFCDELIRVFEASGLRAGGQRLDPGERIEVEVVTRAEALDMIDDGRIRDGKTIAAILLSDRHRRDRGP